MSNPKPFDEDAANESAFSGRRRLSLILCALLHGLNHALQLMLPPLYLSMREDLRLDGLSPVMLLGTIYFVVYAVVGLPCGMLADRFSKKKLLVAGTLVNSLAFCMVAYSPSYKLLVAAMILGGLGGGTYHPVGSSLISNLFKNEVGRAFGILGIGASLGLFFGPLASGFLGQHFGWRASCMIFGLFGAAFAVAFALIMPEEKREERPARGRTAAGEVGLISVLPVLAVFVLRDFGFWGMTYLTPSMIQTGLGFTLEAAGVILGLMSLTGVISQPLGGVMSDRFGRRKVIALTLAVSAPLVLLFPYAGPFSLYPVALVAGFLLLATVPVVDAAASEKVPPSMRGRLFGLMMTIGTLLGALSPFVMGLIHDTSGGYGAAYLVMALSILFGAGLSVMVFSR